MAIKLTSRLVALLIACVVTHGAAAQQPSRRAATHSPVGTWRGTSTCLVRPSPCHDEVVVYRITPTRTTDSLSMDARKIVRGQEEEMAVLGCRVAPPDRLDCYMRNGTWRFHLRGDSLVGELRLPNGTKFRDVRTKRAPS